jgi:hypothetical protein
MLQPGIGHTTLAFAMPTKVTQKLGRSLLAMTASAPCHGVP